jgi:hypothetical protein
MLCSLLTDLFSLKINQRRKIRNLRRRGGGAGAGGRGRKEEEVKSLKFI